MLVKQISVFLENKSGRLAEVTDILGKEDIDISALSIADTTDFGILRLIVNRPEQAEKVLKESGFTVSCTNVIAISVVDEPGGLAAALKVLDKASIGIEYMYAFVGKTTNEALVILRVEEPERAAKELDKNNILVLPAERVYEL